MVEEQAEPFFVEMRESLSRFQGDFRRALIHCVMFAMERRPLMEGHQMLLGKANGAATIRFYLGSANMRKNLRILLEESFVQAQKAGNVDSSWQLDDLLNGLVRLIYSFIKHPEPAENIERLVNAFLLPAEIPLQ